MLKAGGNVGTPFNQQPVSHRCHRTKRLIVDIEVMAHADAVMGMTLSNVAQIVGILRKSRYGDVGTFYDWHTAAPVTQYQLFYPH